MRLNSKFSAMVAPLLLTACSAPAPSSEGVVAAIRDTVHAQGGVCKGQVFPWLEDERAYGVAKVNENNSVTVLTHRPTRKWSLIGRGDSNYSASVSIPDLKIKVAKDCSGPSAP